MPNLINEAHNSVLYNWVLTFLLLAEKPLMVDEVDELLEGIEVDLGVFSTSVGDDELLVGERVFCCSKGNNSSVVGEGCCGGK